MKENSIIHLRGMDFYAYHGVLPEENKLGQKFIVDIDIYLGSMRFTDTDRVEDTINYAEVYHVVKRSVENTTYRLIETLAEAIASNLLAAFHCEGVNVQVHKPHAPIPECFQDIAVEIYRTQRA